ncbi:GNAT family N-acetyltransferase [Paludibacter sp. 221]|uniref:GNAT family N-acetyltransferase n=1 Tax=Paludibacter sp. 221 TaxID=2302939 RepID=UPI0013D750D2|nr:GNAT family N-acetyltransferase [Paludibacter sp. 221]NDV45934.1 GNAT family N-acetyltransferase [Paludibacter sp. 221]
MDYFFALAKRSDTPEILKLYRSLIGTPGCTWHSEYPNREITESDIDAESLYMITDKSHKIIAVATAGKDNELDELDWESKNPCYLARVGVLTEKQGLGIGGLLLKKVIFAVKKRGFDGIRMLVSPDNTAALALYKHYGFAKRSEVYMYDHDYLCYELIL